MNCFLVQATEVLTLICRIPVFVKRREKSHNDGWQIVLSLLTFYSSYFIYTNGELTQSKEVTDKNNIMKIKRIFRLNRKDDYLLYNSHISTQSSLFFWDLDKNMLKWITRSQAYDYNIPNIPVSFLKGYCVGFMQNFRIIHAARKDWELVPYIRFQCPYYKRFSRITLWEMEF